MPRFAPRYLYACIALALLASAAWVDRDLLSLPSYLNLARGYRIADDPAPAVQPRAVALSPRLAAVESLRRALRRCEESAQRYGEALRAELSAPLDAGLLEQLQRSDGSPAVVAYWRARDAHWPAYAEALAALQRTAGEAQRQDPTNALYDVAAGLAGVELAVWPPHGDPLCAEFEREALAPSTRVLDAQAMERARARLERGLSQPTFSTYSAEHVDLLSTDVVGTPLRQLGERLRAASSPDRPEELAWLFSGETLLRAAAAHEPRAPLARLTRGVGLRLASESEAALGLMIGGYLALEADRMLAEEPGQLGVAAAAEADALADLQDVGRPPVGEEGPLGLLDRVSVRHGLWSRGYDPALNRGLDAGMMRSLTLWALMLAALGWLVTGAWASRRPAGGCRASFGLGRGLGVVAPSFGLAALLLVVTPLVSSELTIVSLAVLVVGVGFSARWLLRRAVRLSLELPVQRWTPLVLVGLGTLVAWFVLEPEALLAGAGLQALGVAAAWIARDRAAPAGLAAFRGRVAVACASLALAGLALTELALVVPRRDACAAGVEAYYLDTLRHGARSFRGGEPLDALLAVKRAAPDELR